jgi:chromosome segregation ATPase
MTDSIEDKLNQLNKELNAKEAGIGNITKERDTLKTDIKDLQKMGSDITPVLDAYHKEYEKLEKDKNDLNMYAARIKLEIDGMINTDHPEELKKKVEDIIDKVDKAISDKGEEVNTFKGEWDTANTNFQSVKEKVDKSRSEFESLKTHQNDVKSCLEKLKILRDTIEKIGTENLTLSNTLKMYFWSKELEEALKCKFRSEEEFKNDLFNAWNELNTQMEDHRTKEKAFLDAKSAYDSGKTEFETLKGKRNQDLLTEIKQIK